MRDHGSAKVSPRESLRIIYSTLCKHSVFCGLQTLPRFVNFVFPAPRPSPIEARDGACASASRMIPPQRTENLSKDARPSRIKKPGMLAGLIAFCALPWVLQ